MHTFSISIKIRYFYIRQEGYVLTLFVCSFFRFLLAGLRKKYLTDFHKIR